MTNAIPKQILLILSIIATLAWGAAAGDVTALSLIKEGNRYVGEHARDKVVEIRSEKSVGGLHPNIWWVVYYDTTASLKATEVKFGAGKMLDVKRPFRLLEPISRADQPLDRDKIKIDSDKAIGLAKKEPLLEKLKITATRLKLERWENAPAWKVTLWAEKLRDPKKAANIGEVILSAGDGQVLKANLHINRVD